MLTYTLGAGGDSLQDREFVGGGLAVLKSLGYSGSSEDEGRSLFNLHKSYISYISYSLFKLLPF